ncbi:unnamed protein product [Closterium sp. NIES-54]
MLRAYGCMVVFHVPKEKRGKLEASGRWGVYLGLAKDQKGWLIWDLTRQQLTVSRDVKFLESLYYKEWKQQQQKLPTTPLIIEADEDGGEPEVEEQQQQQQQQDAPQGAARPADCPRRDVRPPNRLTYPSFGKPKVVRAGSVAEQCDEDEIAHCYWAAVSEPKTLAEALSGPDAEKWKQSVKEEYDSLLENETWELCELPPGKKAISSKLIFRHKYGPDGELTRYKSRLVAKGFQQTKGKDFDEIFAPVGRGTTLRVMLGMAANRGWRIKQMDITTAFLNGIILEELYMLQPEGLDDGSGRVCRLKKAIYGLKQAPRAWYHKLEETLLAGGFKKSECDHSLFLLQEKEQFLMLLVYVDDILLFSKSSAIIERVEEMQEMQFKCSKMGNVKYYLGMHVERDLDKVVLRLHQRKYCEGLAEKYGLQDGGKPATPLPSGFTVEPCANEEVVGESDRKLFHSMRLQRDATDLGKGEMLLTCYTDASFNSVKADGTSIGGYVCLFGGGAVSLHSKKQNEVGQSSCETEYMALHHGAKEVVWLRRLLEEIGVCQKEPTVIFCENESAVKLAKNACLHGLTKHIRPKWHWVRRLLDKEVRLEIVKTHQQAADILTKRLAESEHWKGMKLAGMSAGKDFQAVAAAVQANPMAVLLDTGCSHHLMGTKTVFVDMAPSDGVKHVRGFNGALQPVEGHGTVALQGEAGKRVLIPNVLYVPGIQANLLSAGQLKESGVQLQGDGDEMLLVAATGGGWQLVLPAAEGSPHSICVGDGGRQEERRATGVPEVAGAGGTADEEVGADAPHRPGRGVPREGVHRLRRWQGHCPRPDVPLHSAAERMAEREMRTAVESVRTMLLHMDVQHHWWHLALRQVVWVRNCLEQPSTPPRTTPYQLLTAKKPDLMLARVWGCMVQFMVPEQQRGGKRSPKARWGLHLGVSPESKGWEVLDLTVNKVVTSVEVIFYDTMLLEVWKAKFGPASGRTQTHPPTDTSTATVPLLAEVNDPADEDVVEVLPPPMVLSPPFPVTDRPTSTPVSATGDEGSFEVSPVVPASGIAGSQARQPGSEVVDKKGAACQNNERE